MQRHQKPSKKKKYNKIIRFTSIPFEMFFIIFGGYKLGEWLDVKYANSDNLYTIISSFVAIILAMGLIVYRVKRIFK